jgi:dihydroorotase-like cyclic amidohydrolase
VHAENGDIIAENQRRLLARGVVGPEGHPAAQPQEVEEEAVRRACSLALQANVPLVVTAPSCPEAAEIIAQFEAKGLVVVGEARSAALALDGSHYYNKCWSHAAAFVASPPLREGEGVAEGLAEALRDGAGLHLVSSGHTGIGQAERAAGQGNFTAIPEGVTGVEERMAVVWERGVEAGKMEPSRWVEVTSTAAARMLNIFPRKGCIAEVTSTMAFHPF